MAIVSLPAATHINVVATELDYSQKSNLGTIRTGSYLSQASMLVYDDILRFQNSTNAPTADISDFNYNQFEGNVLWFMDELVGMESDWIKTAEASSTTAYGYVQFTEASVQTAINRYINHLERFNARSLTRDWVPYSIKLGETLSIPEWLTTLKNSTKTHKEKLDALTYDEILALAFVHLHSGKSKDSNFVLLAKGDIYASKEIYKNNHHTNPDTATLSRLEGFFPWRKQAQYNSGNLEKNYIIKTCNFSTKDKTSTDVINKIRQKLILHNGDDLFNAYKNAHQNDTDFLITDITSDIALGQYKKYNSGLINKSLSGNSQYKAFKFNYWNLTYDYYFYRSGDVITEWLQNIENELSNSESYNYDELCQTIDSWPFQVHTYILDWFKTNTADANYAIPPTKPYVQWSVGFYYEYNNSWNNIHPNGIMALGLSTGDNRTQLSNLFHEAGGHAMHPSKNPAKTTIWGKAPGLPLTWGGTYNTPSGNNILLTDEQVEALKTVYNTYRDDIKPKLATLKDDKETKLKNLNTIIKDFNSKIKITKALGEVYIASGLFDDLKKWEKASDISNAAYNKIKPANIIWETSKTLLEDFINTINNLPMNNIEFLSEYKIDKIEEEFLSRIYQLMVMNKCITFVDDIWPIMKEVSPSINDIISKTLAKKIDTVMREDMKLNLRTYII